MDEDYNKMDKHYDEGRDLRTRNQHDGWALHKIWVISPTADRRGLGQQYSIMDTAERKSPGIGATCRPWQFTSVKDLSDHFYTSSSSGTEAALGTRRTWKPTVGPRGLTRLPLNQGDEEWTCHVGLTAADVSLRLQVLAHRSLSRRRAT
jgi:hypothetical protein